jgi:malonyl-ACP O-methyltransferase BioC
MINKEKVAKKFKQSLESYNQEALVQKKTAKHLTQAILRLQGKTFNSIFEIGCGTGILTELIYNSFSFNKYTANDIVNECKLIITKKFKNINFVCGDAEKQEIITPNTSLIVSNATVQWFENLPLFFENAYNKLEQNGILAFTTFSKDNLREVRMLTGTGLNYLSLNEIEKYGNKFFKTVYKKEETITLFFKSPMNVLKHFKKTGVNSICTKAMTGKELKNFIYRYEKQFGNEGCVSLTYTPITVIFKKQTVKT